MKKIKSLVSVLIASLAFVTIVSCSDEENGGSNSEGVIKKEYVGDIEVSLFKTPMSTLEGENIYINIDTDSENLSISTTVDISSLLGQEDGALVLPVEVDNLPYVIKTDAGLSAYVVDWNGEYTIMVGEAETTLKEAWIAVISDGSLEAELFIQAGEDLLNVEVNLDIEALEVTD